jgi:hypothetical protein
VIDERLQAAIDAITGPYSEYMSDFEDLKEYYQDEHGERGWIRGMVHDFMGLTPADGRAYQSARRRIERWADGSTHPGKKNKDALGDLGKQLPPTRRGVPPGGINVHVKGTFVVSSKEGARYRDIDVHMDEMEALDFVDSPSYEEVFETYGVDGDMFAGGMESDVQVEMF